MAFCIDASALIPFLLPEQPPTQAIREFWANALRRRDRLVTPPLLFAETTSVLRRYVHSGAIAQNHAVASLQQLFRLPLSVIHHESVYIRALELAEHLGLARAYDVQYLAVAEMEDCSLVTLDRRLYESARTLGIAACVPQ